MECSGCGTCCVAPDISTLAKKAGARCRHLTESLECGIYPERPAVCRGYRPDEICRSIAAPTLEERVARYLRLFGMEQP
ncbi:MAG TPA: zinc/iron-chelating domain-containing protein [Geobacter sp.]|nr:zinc/iron-chelating domain-containing protein [Geobacter sp.]